MVLRVRSANMLVGVLTREKKMKNRLFVYVVLALALSGCTTLKWVPRFEERRTPQVTVSEGRIVVTPEILFYFQDERDFIITFQLPKESGLTFPAKEAVVIEGELTDALIRSGDRVGVVLNRDQKEILDPDLKERTCRRLSDIEVACRNLHTRPGVYKYTIRVNGKDGRPLPSRDPPFVNM
jgi:hypothetical protein